MNDMLVCCSGLTKSYGVKPALDHVDLQLAPGKIIGLLGPNGAGKSTLLKILAGIIPIDSGQRTPGTTTRIGYFSQARTENLNPENTVLEEIMKCSAEIREEEARSILGSFLFRRLDVEKRVSVLSGGEKSRLSLVKFLVDPPNLLLMDEPTSALDPISTSRIEELAMELKKDYTIVMVTHNMQQAARISDKTAFFLLGDMVEFGPTEKIFSMPQDRRTEDYITGRFG